MPQLMRFALVIAAGLGIDLTTGYLLANVVGLPLAVGAAAGFIAGALFNYVLHELWTFPSGGTRLSSARATLYVAATLVTFLVRVSVTFLLSPIAVSHLMSLAVLLAAAATSFVVNYLISRFVVYRP